MVASIEKTGEYHMRYQGAEERIDPDKRYPKYLQDI